MQTAPSIPRRLLTWAASLYALAMVVYLVLRLVFGDGFWWLSLLNTFAHFLFLPLVPLLALVALVRSRLAALRLLPLAVVGGVWFVPLFLPKPQQSSNGLTLRAATFNMRSANADLSRVGDWLQGLEADVLCLQETPEAFGSDYLPRLRQHFPYQVKQADIVRWVGFPTDNIVLSRYPIVSTEAVDLGDSDENAPSPLRTLLDVNGQTFAVYNLHLAWPGGNYRLGIRPSNYFIRVVYGFDDRIRNGQVTRLIEHLQSEPYPFIVMGDFNTSSSSATYERLAEHLHDSYREAGSGFGGTWPVAEVLGLPALVPPLIRIDYIWHSDHFRTLAAQRGPRLTSDHLPVLATLELLPQS